MIVTSLFILPMQEDFIFKRRNRLKNHNVNTSKVLLYCYRNVSKVAKYTYQIIDGYDWEDKETGDSKGYVFPAVKKLAKYAYTTERNIRRHIAELIEANLLTRIRRRNKPSILIIEDPSEEEIKKYFDLIKEERRQTPEHQQSSESSHQQIVFHSQEELNAYIANMQHKSTENETEKNFEKSRTDKNVRSEKAGERTFLSVAYKEENEKKENEINVNEDFNSSDGEKRSGMQGVREIMRRLDIVSKKPSPKRLKTKVANRDVRIPGQGEKGIRSPATPEEKAQRDYFATHIATELQDEESLGCYRVIAEKVPQPIIFEKIAAVKETWKQGKIKKSRGALFVDLIKTYCKAKQIDLAFAENVLEKQHVLVFKP